MKNNRVCHDCSSLFKAIKDIQLFIIVGILLTVDIILLSAWQIVDPLKIQKYESQIKVKTIFSVRKHFNLPNFFLILQTEGKDIVTLWSFEECRSKRRSIWFTMQSIYKGILMVRKDFKQGFISSVYLCKYISRFLFFDINV